MITICPFCSEITAWERERLTKLLALDGEARDSYRFSLNQKVIIDTDVGTDVDDALALLMALNAQEPAVELLGITTVYGHSALRAATAVSIAAGVAKRPHCRW